MVTRLPVHHLDPAAGADGQVPVISGGKFTIGAVPFDAEAVIDAVAAALDPGSGISIAYDDVAGTITISASGGGAGGGNAVPGWIAGNYYAHPAFTATIGSGSALNAGAFIAHPLLVPEGASIDRIAAQCASTGAGAVFRLGIYDSDANGHLQNLLGEGVVDASAAGARTCTVSIGPLSAGIYWIGSFAETAGGLWMSWANPTTSPLGFSSALSNATLWSRLQAAGVPAGGMPTSAPAGLAPAGSGTAAFMTRVRAA